jgi:DNA modification methylase
MKLKITEIVYDGKIYPREKPSSAVVAEYADALLGGAKFPPIILETDTNRLLDGNHRWKAHVKAKETLEALSQEEFAKLGIDASLFDEIECVYHDVPEGIDAKLYALFLSSRHGFRPTNHEKELACLEHFTKHPGCSLDIISKYAGVSPKTVKEYLKPLLAKFEEDKRSVIMRLNLLGWTQTEIAEKLQAMWPDAKGVKQASLSESLSEIGIFRIPIKTDLEKGHSPAELAKRYALPEILVWTIALEGPSDDERLKKLNINVQPYDVWNFAKCHDLFGCKHPGRIPGELVAHVLYFFTDPGNLIIDPMVGSGTTIDVCLAMGRKCYGYDIDTRHERPDIMVHDMAVDGPPDRFKKADLIFWDPPYFSKMDAENKADGYMEGSVSGLPRAEYLGFFEQSLAAMYAAAKKGAKLAFLMADWDDDTGEQEGIFIWDYLDIIRQAGWKPVRHIQAPLPTQQVHGDIVNKFRVSRRLARLERYLIMATK